MRILCVVFLIFLEKLLEYHYLDYYVGIDKVVHPELFRLKVSCYLSICRGGSGGRKLTVIVRRYRRRHAERRVYVKEKFFNKI